MSIARHHAEWLSLLEISGPFLSMPVLLRAFPQGLDAHDPDTFRALKLAYEEFAAIEARYADPQPRLFAVAVTFLLPEKLAQG